MTVTASQLTQTAKALSAIDWSQIAYLNLSSLPDDAVIAEDALSVVAVFWPPAALLAEALAIAVVLEPVIAANVTPDPDPEVDAQTTQSRGGRNS
jgi:hypothetical protein